MEKHHTKKYDLVEKEEKRSRFFRTTWETYFVLKNHTAMIHDFIFRNLDATATLNITGRITS